MKNSHIKNEWEKFIEEYKIVKDYLNKDISSRFLLNI